MSATLSYSGFGTGEMLAESPLLEGAEVLFSGCGTGDLASVFST
jgi:hypothetical protein